MADSSRKWYSFPSSQIEKEKVLERPAMEKVKEEKENNVSIKLTQDYNQSSQPLHLVKMAEEWMKISVNYCLLYIHGPDCIQAVAESTNVIDTLG